MSENTSKIKKYSKLIFESAGITVLAIIAAVFISTISFIFLLSLGYDLDHALGHLFGILSTQMGILIVAFYYIRSRNIEVSVKQPGNIEGKYAFIGIGASLLVAGILAITLPILNLRPESGIQELASASPLLLPLVVILSFVLIAPVEEYFFRGAIQGRLRKYFGEKTSITISSLLFGMIHIVNYAGEWSPVLGTIILTTTIGGILGIQYERTNNILVPIFTHGCYNTFIIIASYFFIL